jgi:hypothetical protein
MGKAAGTKVVKTLIATPSKFAIILKTPRAPNKKRNTSTVSRSKPYEKSAKPRLSPRKTRNLSKLF